MRWPRHAARRRPDKRALPFDWRALGDIRTHSSSLANVRLRAACARCSPSSRPASVRATSCSCPRRESLPAVQLKNPLRHVVQEITIVGDRHHRSRVLGQVAFEPVDALCIQVVGGLVKEKQIGRDNRRRQSAMRRRSPPLRLPTGESAGGRRSASIAISMVRWRSQPWAASIFASRSACSAPTFS